MSLNCNQVKSRKIIHIDMDCFFAAVEMRENPAYRNRPLAVGGSSDRRGVISTCNYQARKFGVRSAMATAQAVKKCPHLLVVPGNMALYKQISQQIRAIFSRYTDKIEPLSLDEAFLDVSDSKDFQGSATLIAESIRSDIANELNLTASAGVAPNKFLAKIASDENKPDGTFVITPEQVSDFVFDLPLRKIPGVGKVTAQKLADIGLITAADVQAYPKEALLNRFGKYAADLIERCYGRDNRALQTERVRKSVGVERTLAQDIYSYEQALAVMSKLLPELVHRIKNSKAGDAIHKQVVKLKFNDFQSTTIEKTSDQVNEGLFNDLLQGALMRQDARGIRLVGISVGLAEDNKKNLDRQMTFEF